MDVSVSGPIDQKTYLKNLGRASAPLAPPGSAYECVVACTRPQTNTVASGHSVTK